MGKAEMEGRLRTSQKPPCKETKKREGRGRRGGRRGNVTSSRHRVFPGSWVRHPPSRTCTGHWLDTAHIQRRNNGRARTTRAQKHAAESAQGKAKPPQGGNQTCVVITCIFFWNSSLDPKACRRSTEQRAARIVCSMPPCFSVEGVVDKAAVDANGLASDKRRAGHGQVRDQAAHFLGLADPSIWLGVWVWEEVRRRRGSKHHPASHTYRLMGVLDSTSFRNAGLSSTGAASGV